MLIVLLACAEPQNLPPELQTSSVANGATIEIGNLGVDVKVTADDPDGDPLQFSWAIDGVGITSEEQQNASSTTSVCALSGANLDGSELALGISDGEDEIGLSWPLAYVGDG